MDILAFCRKRDIATEGIKIVQDVEWSKEAVNDSEVVLKVELPPDFPEKYDAVITKAVNKCLVASLGKGLDDSSFRSEVSRKIS